jgi:hypothetical protein
MRTMLTILVVVALGACKGKPRAGELERDRNPYRDVMPEKMKQKVEDSQKKEEQRDDRLIENAK